MPAAADLPILTVLDAASWSRWLASPTGRSSAGVWLTLAKKNVTSPTSLTYSEALDEALCHGWIDGQRRSGNDGANNANSETYGQRFTPRTPKSAWSQRNVSHIARLESQGRIREQGKLAIDAAKADGRWDAAYAGSKTAELPADLVAAVEKAGTGAQEALAKLSRQEKYAMYHRLAMLKTAAGREKRIAAFVETLLAASDGGGGDTSTSSSSAALLQEAGSSSDVVVVRRGISAGEAEADKKTTPSLSSSSSSSTMKQKPGKPGDAPVKERGTKRKASIAAPVETARGSRRSSRLAGPGT